jgi:hypothetical protein
MYLAATGRTFELNRIPPLQTRNLLIHLRLIIITMTVIILMGTFWAGMIQAMMTVTMIQTYHPQVTRTLLLSQLRMEWRWIDHLSLLP